MQTTIRNNITDLPYSLHDAVVTDIELVEDKITFRFAEGIFELYEGSCRKVNGCIELDGVDWNFCSAYVFNSVKNEGRFGGKKMSLQAFARKYFDKTSQNNVKASSSTPHHSHTQAWQSSSLKGKPDCPRFEVINETYGYNKSTFSGWLWVKNKPKECILELYHAGDMRYVTEE